MIYETRCRNRVIHPPLALIVVLAVLIASLSPAQQAGAASEECFPATGRCLRGRFLDYWHSHGGLALNGYPLTNEQGERPEDGKFYRVQYFERVRLEYHPENPPPYDVLLGQFGRRIRPADPPVAANGRARFFPETGHNVAGDFLDYWQGTSSGPGGLTQFGFPLSEELSETLEDGKPYTVQYFERARFERHPENPASYAILLGQFGRRILASLPPTITPGTVGRLTESASWGKGWPAVLAFSPDGRWLAVGSSGGLTLYDAASLTERRFLRLDNAVAVAFSPDSQRLAIGLGSATTEVRQVPDLASVATLDTGGANYGAASLRFSPDGGLLAVGTGSTIALYRTADGQFQRRLTGHRDQITSLAFSSDGATLVSADSGAQNPEDVHASTIKRWRVADGALLVSHTPDDIHLNGIVSADGSLVVTSGYSRPRIWRFVADTLVLVSTLPSDTGIQRGAVAFSRSGTELLVGTTRGKVQRWRVADGTLLATLQEGPERIELVGLGTDEMTVAALSSAGVLQLIRATDSAQLGTASGYDSGTPKVVSPDWTTLVTGVTQADGRGALRLWRLATGEPLRTIQTDSGYIMAAAYSPDGQILASSGANYAIQLWRPSDGTLIRKLEGQKSEAEQLVFSPDGRYLAAAARFREIQVWRLSDGALLNTFTFTSVFGSVVFSPDGEAVAFADSGKVQLRQIADGRLIGEFATGTGVYGDRLALSPDGTTLITSYTSAAQATSIVQFWDWTSRSRLREIRIADGIISATFSPDGALVALGGYNDTLQLVEVSSGAILRSENHLHYRVSLVSFSPDGTALASATFDGTIHLWGLPR